MISYEKTVDNVDSCINLRIATPAPKNFGFCPKVKEDISKVINSIHKFSECRLNEGKMTTIEPEEVSELLEFAASGKKVPE